MFDNQARIRNILTNKTRNIPYKKIHTKFRKTYFQCISLYSTNIVRNIDTFEYRSHNRFAPFKYLETVSFVIHLHDMLWNSMVRYRSAASFVWPLFFVCLCQNYCTHQILPFHHEYRIKYFGFCLTHAKRVEPAQKPQFSSKQLQMFTVDRLHARCIRLPTK